MTVIVAQVHPRAISKSVKKDGDDKGGWWSKTSDNQVPSMSIQYEAQDVQGTDYSDPYYVRQEANRAAAQAAIQ